MNRQWHACRRPGGDHVAYLENQKLLRRERDSRSRAERYVVDDGIWFEAVMASVRIALQIAEVCREGARKLGSTTAAGARLEGMSQVPPARQ